MVWSAWRGHVGRGRPVDEAEDQEHRAAEQRPRRAAPAGRWRYAGAGSVSRRTYPAPRTVCRSGRSKSLSILPPQAADVHVDDVGLGVEVVAPHLLEQHGPGDHLPGVPHEVLQQLELPRLERDGPALRARRRG